MPSDLKQYMQSVLYWLFFLLFATAKQDLLCFVVKTCLGNLIHQHCQNKSSEKPEELFCSTQKTIKKGVVQSETTKPKREHQKDTHTKDRK